MNFQTMTKQRKFILIAAAIGIISMFLPWINFGFLGSINGMHGEGIIVFLGLAVAGVLAFMGDQTKNIEKSLWMGTLIAGGISALLMVYYFIRMLSNGGLSVLGFGFWLALLASIGVVLAAYMFRTPGDNFKDGFDSLKKDIGTKMNSTTDSGNTNSGTNTGNTNPPL